MRYVLSGRQPEPSAILLVESGSREIVERLADVLRKAWGEDARFDLVTCYSGLPRGFDARTTRVFRSSDFRGRDRQLTAIREMRQAGYTHVGIICSGEPVLTKWKWAVALGLPSKVFIINENADFFWLDCRHLGVIRRFAIDRAGLTGAGAVRTLARVLSFPFTLAYLILYAAYVHGLRAIRIARGTALGARQVQ